MSVIGVDHIIRITSAIYEFVDQARARTDSAGAMVEAILELRRRWEAATGRIEQLTAALERERRAHAATKAALAKATPRVN